MAKSIDSSLLEYLTNQPVLLPEEQVDVPEWQRVVTLRGWTARERDAFEEDSLQRAQKKSGNGAGARRGQQPLTADLANFRARLIARTIVEDGQRVFASAKGEELLGAQPAQIIDRLFTVAQRLHGMSNQDVESLVGNVPADSEEITENASSSSSPAH